MFCSLMALMTMSTEMFRVSACDNYNMINSSNNIKLQLYQGTHTLLLLIRNFSFGTSARSSGSVHADCAAKKKTCRGGRCRSGGRHRGRHPILISRLFRTTWLLAEREHAR